MPRIEDIEQFVSTLNSLGDEPAILAERGESIEPVAVPDAGLSDDLKDLFGDLGNDEAGSDLSESLTEFEDTAEAEGPNGLTPVSDEEPLDFS